MVSVLDMGSVTPQVAARLRQWPVGGAARVRGSWLGRLDGGDVGFRFSRGTVERDIDAAALLSHTPLTYAPPPPIDASSPHGAELERRRRLAVATGPFRGGGIRFGADSANVVTRSSEAARGGSRWTTGETRIGAAREGVLGRPRTRGRGLVRASGCGCRQVAHRTGHRRSAPDSPGVRVRSSPHLRRERRRPAAKSASGAGSSDLERRLRTALVMTGRGVSWFQLGLAFPPALLFQSRPFLP